MKRHYGDKLQRFPLIRVELGVGISLGQQGSFLRNTRNLSRGYMKKAPGCLLAVSIGYNMLGCTPEE